MRHVFGASHRTLRPGLLLVRLLFLYGLLHAAVALAPAQQARLPARGELRVDGRVLKQGQGQAGVQVTLHRVTRDSAGVVSTTRTGPKGEFSFPSLPADTSGFHVYFTTVDYLGVRYFGPALHPGDPREGYTVEVFDTAAAQPGADRVRVARRDLMLLPEAGRGWEINEALQIRNDEPHTLVSVAGLPTWEFRLPEGVGEFEIGEGEIPPDQVQRMGDRVFLLGPLQPGAREIFLRYRLADHQSSLTVPVDPTLERVSVYVRQPSPPLDVRGLVADGPVSAQGASFLRFSARNPMPGTDVQIEWADSAGLPVNPTQAAVVLVLLVLSLGAAAAVRRGRPTTSAAFRRLDADAPRAGAADAQEMVAADPVP